MNRRPVPAVSRAIAALRLLGDSNEPLGVHAIARATGMIPSTCLHILRELVVEGLVGFDEVTKRYALAPGILALADKMLHRTPLAHTIQPMLDRLTRKYPVSAGLMQIVDRETMVVIAMSNRSGIGLKVELGLILAPLNAATGRCMAGFGEYTEAELRRRFRTLEWANPLSFKKWRAESADAARLGYGVDGGNFTRGIAVISTPIFGRTGGISHAIVALGIREEIERCGVKQLAEELMAMAAPFSGSTQRASAPTEASQRAKHIRSGSDRRRSGA